MARQIPKIPISELVGHALVGAALSGFPALTALICNTELLSLIMNSAFPKLAVVAFVSSLCGVFAIGSAITGFMFSTFERR